MATASSSATALTSEDLLSQGKFAPAARVDKGGFECFFNGLGVDYAKILGTIIARYINYKFEMLCLLLPW